MWGDAMEAQDKYVILNDEYKPASEILGEDFPNWYYYQHDIPTKKIWQVYIENHTYNLPIVNRAILFRWIVPERPNLYSENDRFDSEARKAGIYRLTYGKPFQKTDALGVVDEEHIKDVAKGLVEVTDDYLQELNDAMKRTFTFNTWKIPYVDVRLDVVNEKEFPLLTQFHQGQITEKVTEMVNNKKASQEDEKNKSLELVKDKLRSLPDYLSILRQLVRENISADEAIAVTGNRGIFTKGI